MEQNNEISGLQSFTTLTNNKIISSKAELDSKTQLMPEMLDWCRRQENIAVLQNGNILCSNLLSRVVQNCKIVMLNKGLIPGPIHPSTPELIRMLLEVTETKASNEAEKAKIVHPQFLALIKNACEINAREIHMEVRHNNVQIRMRKDGGLFLYTEWNLNLIEEVMKSLITSFNPLTQQNTTMPLTVDQRDIVIFLTSVPAYQGFDVFVKIQSFSEDKSPTLEKLGYTPDQIGTIKKAIRMPVGAIIFAGPKGCGKSTSISSTLQLINPDRKIFSIEERMEKIIPNATQVCLDASANDQRLAEMVKTVMKMDPDVINLGDLRDEETAKTLVQTTMSGHLVFGHIKAHSIMSIIPRLSNLGVSKSLLTNPNFLVCFISQRLVPLLCSHCAKPLTSSREHRSLSYRWQPVLSDTSNLRVRGQCTHCNNQGIKGRTVVAEIIWVDKIAHQFIKNDDLVGWKEHLKNRGWLSYQDHLISLVGAGQCDPTDAEKIIGDLNNIQ